MQKKQRVVITGMGLVSCFGIEVDQFYNSLLEGRSAVCLLDSLDPEQFPSRIAAPVAEYDVSAFVGKKQARRIDRFLAHAITAGKKAVQDAGIDLAEGKPSQERYGIVMGSGMGGLATVVDNVNMMEQQGPKRVSPFLIPYILTNMAAGLLGQELGFMGPNYSVSTACATSNHAIINAANHIRSGSADLMVCGGVEATLLPIAFAGFSAARALSQRNEEPHRASRPWDRSRDGFVMGEGAGVLVLESYEHAKKRGAKPIAEYLGGAFSCDAYHITNPHPEGKGVVLCLREALRDAAIEAREVNYINAHATSTPVGDLAEIRGLQEVFTDYERVAINATKSMIGHCLGAAGALEAIATLCAIRSEKVHPTINLEDPEPELRFVAPRQALSWGVDKAISTSFGFGGHNAAVIFGKSPDEG